MKIKYTNLNNPPCADFLCEVCGKFAHGYIKCTGFDIPIYVCITHTDAITADNPLLISFLELLNICQ